MTSIILLKEHERAELHALHQAYGTATKFTGCSTVAASFILTGSLIVISCGSLCLFLPGVNVITDVVFRAVIPGSLGIMSSLPFILYSVKSNLEGNRIHKKMIDRMIYLLDEYKIPEKTRKERVKFILKNFLEWQLHPDKEGKLIKNIEWTDYYQNELIKSLKQRIGEDKKSRNPRQERIARAFDKVLVKIPNASKKKK